MLNKRFRAATLLTLGLTFAAGCTTAPKAEDQAAFVEDSRTAVAWFEDNVEGLGEQVAQSAGYIIFPSVGQVGVIFGGTKTGRGMVCRASGIQIGWANLNTASLGLQAGVQGFKMLVVFEDAQTFKEFTDNRLSGNVSGVAVLADAGGSAKASFVNGVAVYQGANTGLMAGVNVGLDALRWEPLTN